MVNFIDLVPYTPVRWSKMVRNDENLFHKIIRKTCLKIITFSLGKTRVKRKDRKSFF